MQEALRGVLVALTLDQDVRWYSQTAWVMTSAGNDSRGRPTTTAYWRAQARSYAARRFNLSMPGQEPL
jgi:hypothetical protein